MLRAFVISNSVLKSMLHHHHPHPIAPKRVVILGSSGFVSTALARHLTAAGIEYLTVASSEVDLTQPLSAAQLGAILSDGDAVVMTSGLTPDKGRDVGTLMKNLSMAQHVGAAVEQSSCAHLVYVSSDAVYDGRELLIRENSTRQPADLYSLMHIAREQILSFTSTKAKTPLCVFCPCAIYGAGDTHNSYGPNRFFRMALKDSKITLFGEGRETRDHVYIDDVARLLVQCLMYRSAGTINAASGEAVTFHDVATRIAGLIGPSVSVDFLPAGGTVTHRQFDVTERVRAFPDFIPTSLDAGLSETLTKIRNA